VRGKVNEIYPSEGGSAGGGGGKTAKEIIGCDFLSVQKVQYSLWMAILSVSRSCIKGTCSQHSPLTRFA